MQGVYTCPVNAVNISTNINQVGRSTLTIGWIVFRLHVYITTCGLRIILSLVWLRHVGVCRPRRGSSRWCCLCMRRLCRRLWLRWSCRLRGWCSRLSSSRRRPAGRAWIEAEGGRIDVQRGFGHKLLACVLVLPRVRHHWPVLCVRASNTILRSQAAEWRAALTRKPAALQSAKHPWGEITVLCLPSSAALQLIQRDCIDVPITRCLIAAAP